LIQSVKGLETKGLGGPKMNVSDVTSGSTDRYGIEFEANSGAEIGIVGEGKANLHLFVFDDQQQSVCSGELPGDIQYCSWMPTRRQTFRIEVRNRGNSEERYKVVTN
jgi:hypothetical protein